MPRPCQGCAALCNSAFPAPFHNPSHLLHSVSVRWRDRILLDCHLTMLPAAFGPWSADYSSPSSTFCGELLDPGPPEMFMRPALPGWGKPVDAVPLQFVFWLLFLWPEKPRTAGAIVKCDPSHASPPKVPLSLLLYFSYRLVKTYPFNVSVLLT